MEGNVPMFRQSRPACLMHRSMCNKLILIDTANKVSQHKWIVVSTTL